MKWIWQPVTLNEILSVKTFGLTDFNITAWRLEKLIQEILGHIAFGSLWLLVFFVHVQWWFVGYGLTSHSAIFQLYSDETVVQFPNFDLLTGTQRHGQLGVFSVRSLPRHGHQDVRRRLLPPCHTQWGYAGNRTQILRSTVQPSTSAPPRQAMFNHKYQMVFWPKF